MLPTAACYGPLSARRRRAFFLAHHTQQMPSPAVTTGQVGHEIMRALAALGGAAAWATLLLLVAG
jgi:hypothetical protein